jgi:hypothetical protein
MSKSVVLGAVVLLALAGCGKQAAESTAPPPSSAKAATESVPSSGVDPDAKYSEGDAVDASATSEDPFPYTLVLTCSRDGFKNEMKVFVCMRGEASVTTDMELTSGESYGLYKWDRLMNPPEGWSYTERGLEIPVASSFALNIQNANKYYTLGVRVFDNNGQVLFQKQAGEFGPISITN